MKLDSFDVVIIGAGINGAACALDAASRGYSTLLIDKSDYGAKTSAGCFKIIHGGLRYLQHLDFPRVFESLKEQKLLRKNASHLVKPIPFLIPTYKKFSKSKFFLGSGLFLYDLLNCFRNKNIKNAEKLPGFKFLNVEQTLKIAPHLDTKDLTGSVVYYDCQITNCERLTWTVVKTAKEYGAKCLNYSELQSAQVVGGRVRSLEIKDLVSGNVFNVKPKAVILSAGPWNSKLISMFGLPAREQVYSKGVQFAVPQLVNDYALAVDSNFRDPEAVISTGARKFFIQPWNGLSLIGTSDSIYKGDPQDFKITDAEVEDFLSQVKEVYPHAKLKNENIKFVFGGLRPVSDSVDLGDVDLSNVDLNSAGLSAVNEDGGKQDGGIEDGGNLGRRPQDSTTSRKAIIRKELDNLVSVTGIKYTTFRLVAKQVCDLVARTLISDKDDRSKTCRTQDIVLFGADKSFEQVESEIGQENKDLFYTFGSASKEVLAKDADVDLAQIKYVTQHEDVVSLDDALYRRTNLGQLKEGIKKKLRE